MLIINRVGILKEGRIILLLLIIIEFSYFTSCLTNTSWLLRAIFALPSLFIIPGAILLAILRRSINNVIKLTVEGFFVSTIILVIFTLIMLMLGLPLIPFNYSLAVLILALSLSIIALIRKIEFKPSKSDGLLASIAFLSYIVLLVYFSRIPRLFILDETSYIADMRDMVLKDRVASWSSIFYSGGSLIIRRACFLAFAWSIFFGYDRITIDNYEKKNYFTAVVSQVLIQVLSTETSFSNLYSFDFAEQRLLFRGLF